MPKALELKPSRGCRVSLAVYCAVVAALAVGHGALAAAPKTATKRPAKEIYGNWLGVGDQGLGPYHNIEWSPQPASVFTPWGAAESKRLGDPQTSQTSYCRPGPGVGVGGNNLFLTQFIKADTHIVQLSEGGSVPRRFYTDGRKHPADLSPTYMGHSITHWEGDTLVVDTIGTRGGGNRPLNGFASNVVFAVKGDDAPRLPPTTDQLHLIERFRLVGDGDIMEIKVVLDDPKAYTRPVTRTSYMQRRRDLDVQELYCEGDLRPESEGYVKQAASN